MNYMTTFRHCFETIRGVCRRCGGPLTPIRTEDNAGNPTFWAFCPGCSRLDWGVDPVLHRAARIMVDDGFVAYKHLDQPSRPGDWEEWRKDQTQGAVAVVAQAHAAMQMAKRDENS